MVDYYSLGDELEVVLTALGRRTGFKIKKGESKY